MSSIEPIPPSSVAGWKEIPLQPTDADPLVPLGIGSGKYSTIFTDSIYAGERSDSPYPKGSLEGALLTVFVRQSVAERLERAQALLPDSLALIVFDAYRPLAVQKSLFESYHGALEKLHPDWTKEELLAETQKYVSIPSTDAKKPSPHNTGGAVDLALISLPPALARQLKALPRSPGDTGDGERRVYEAVAKSAQLLEFGTAFDFGGVEAASRSIEDRALREKLSPAERQALENRRLLYAVMHEAGMQPYPEEWWHFNAPESQMGAAAAGRRSATLGAMQLSADNMLFEIKRHRAPLGRETSLARAAVIAPSPAERDSLGVA